MIAATTLVFAVVVKFDKSPTSASISLIAATQFDLALVVKVVKSPIPDKSPSTSLIALTKSLLAVVVKLLSVPIAVAFRLALASASYIPVSIFDISPL